MDTSTGSSYSSSVKDNIENLVEVLPSSQMPAAPPTEKVVTSTVEDDDSDRTVAPSVEQEQQGADTANTSSTEPTFDIPSEYLQNVFSNEPLVYSITPDQYAEIENRYSTTPLPSDVLFPWLHGVDGRSYQQNLFFGVRRSMVPRHRGLTLVHADESAPYTSRLINAVLPSEILTPDGAFLNIAEREPYINLRNFKIQVSRYATISDIVVYGRGADKVAQIIAAAQQKLRSERMAYIEKVRREAGSRAVVNANNLVYRVFIIQGLFRSFEQKFPQLVSFDSNGERVNNISFWEREREEMRAMSSATEISPHVWVGNTQDVPASLRQADMEDDDYSETDENPHQFSVCIEAHDLADMPLPSTLTLARETLNELPERELPPEIIHLDVYSTGVPMTSPAFEEFYDRLLRLLHFMDDQTSRGRDILIHCSDGYTDTSLLALTWIMYKEKIPLPEAYLYLQERRSFFVYAVDVAALRRIDYHLRTSPPTAPSTRENKRKREDTNGAQEDGPRSCPPRSAASSDEIRTQSFDEMMMMNEAEDEEEEMENGDYESTTNDKRVLHDDGYINRISNPGQNDAIPGRPVRAFADVSHVMIDEDEIDERLTPQMLAKFVPEADDDEKARFPWFYSQRFEGSFPSRILPFLYLGNLNHATNPEMLRALGITHVVSVGENANLDNTQFNLLFLDNLYDDGIDSIHGRLDSAIQFIEEARSNGGKCLIHCRVGVSRSATFTISYVMHHLKFSLVQAYLYVRARRLNVIIQPNLKFMYELLQLEQRLQGRVSITWPSLSKEIHLLNMSYRES